MIFSLLSDSKESSIEQRKFYYWSCTGTYRIYQGKDEEKE